MSGIPDEGVDGGRPGFDGALTQVLAAIGGLHAQMSTAIARPGGKLQADALAAVIGQTASIVGGLAAELAAIEKALKEEAYTASRYGVKIGVDGQPPPVPAGPPVGAATSERHWALAYRQAFERAMGEVRQARQRAAGQLMDLYAQLDSQLRAVESELAFGR